MNDICSLPVVGMSELDALLGWGAEGELGCDSRLDEYFRPFHLDYVISVNSWIICISRADVLATLQIRFQSQNSETGTKWAVRN